MNTSDPWAYFDRVYCISIAARNDRRHAAKRQFAAVGLAERVDFVIVDKHPENPEQGIFESHLSCLAKGLATGAKRILIFEDDVFFRNFDPRTLQRACNGLRAVPSWDAFFLGCITNESKRTPSESLVRISYRCLAHAYGLNASFARQLIGTPWNGIPYDEMLRRHQADFFALSPMCAFQGHSRSDNHTVMIDRLRRLCGGLPFIQRMNEFYQNHKRPLLALHLTVLLLLGALACRLW